MSISAAPVADPGGSPAWALTGDELLAELDELHQAVASLQTRRLEVMARFDDLGHAKELGARGTVELLALRHRLDPAAVRRDLRLATALPKYGAVAAGLIGHSSHPNRTDPASTDTRPHDASTGDTGPGDTGPGDTGPGDTGLDAAAQVADADGAGAASAGAASAGAVGASADGASADGAAADDAGADGVAVTVHPAQAAVIVSALERVPRTVPVADIEVAEQALVTAARTFAPRDLRRLADAAVDRLDPDGPEPDEDRARENRRLYLSRGRHGVRFQGFLAAEDAELFETLIDVGSKPVKPADPADGDRDPRTHGQRQADALVEILRGAAGHGVMPAHGGIRPQVAVTITLDDLIAAGRHSTGDPTFGAGLSATAVRMLACDAGIIPIILGSESQPLDVGQDARSVTPAIRRALIARDGGCVIPGCGAPPGHCDGHHVKHWSTGGATSVDNAVLACPPHHRAIHAGIWKVEIVNGVVHVTRPAWADPGPPRAGPERPCCPDSSVAGDVISGTAPDDPTADSDPAASARRGTGTDGDPACPTGPITNRGRVATARRSASPGGQRHRRLACPPRRRG